MHKERTRRSWHGWISKLLLAMLVASAASLAGQTTCLAATSVTLSWNASTGATGYKVYYQQDSSTQPFKGTGAAQGASPITLGNVTSTTLSGLDPSHNYYAAVTAFNSSGESPYSNIVLIPESVPPTVSITAPTNGSTATGTVSVTANATDNIGVTKVEFYVNGTLAATDTATPYMYSWNTSNLAAGTYTLMAKAYDAAGNVGTSSNVSVSVAKDTTAPTVSLTAPTSGATLTGTTTMTANASDNIGVTKVEFYANGTLLGATNVAPYSYSWNTASVANGSYTLTSKAYDAAGNVGTSNSVSVTTSNSTTTTGGTGSTGSTGSTGTSYTIWPTTTAPKQADSGPDSSVELGVKFKADSNGYITGIRFYKASTNTGTHTGTLWSASGTKLATATFSGETASGWQQVNFATPVAVTAGTIYVASYHAPAGHYSGDINYFASTGYDNAPLHALANGVSGYNGCFAYGSTPAFPNQGYNSCNYWVDVVFSSSSTSGTTTPPTSSAYTIWPGTTTPKQADSGPDSSVELGVKFKADYNGYITGVRFYKASTNTGTHTGTLWSATGTQLATATFTNETASGWQQVNFSTPVAVTAGTVYVASYHSPAGHYAGDINYFASAGYDNAPLHALANGVSGYNGCFAYGSTSAFPNQGYNSCNYWVDVVYTTSSSTSGTSTSGTTTTTSTPTLTSIAVTPNAQSITTGATLQYSATGTYSDGSTKTLTTSATWSSSTPAIATVTTSGLGTGISAGTATISANVSGVTGSTSLTVTAPATVTNVSLFSGTIPATADSGPDSSAELGVKFTSDVNGYITGIRFYKASTNTGTHTGSLWSSGGTLLATGTFTGETASGWQQLNFATPVAITAGTVYVASYHCPNGDYSDDQNFFSGKGQDVAPLHALADGISGYDGVYNYGTTTIFPNQGYNASNYYVDVVFHQ